jgi:hypothetical protein
MLDSSRLVVCLVLLAALAVHSAPTTSRSQFLEDLEVGAPGAVGKLRKTRPLPEFKPNPPGSSAQTALDQFATIPRPGRSGLGEKLDNSYTTLIDELRLLRYDEVEALSSAAARERALARLEQMETAVLGDLALTAEVQVPRLSKSRKEIKTKKQDRIAALNSLKDDLAVVRKRLQSYTNIKAVKPVPHTFGAGPKLGFESEMNQVWVFDVDKVPVGYNKLLAMAAVEDLTREELFVLAKGLDKGSFNKRDKLFSGPGGTWSATADTSLHDCTDLEFVTEPLTPDQWLDEKAQHDLEVLSLVLHELRQRRTGGNYLVVPSDLHPELKIHVSGARLLIASPYRDPRTRVRTGGLGTETQVTMAQRIPKYSAQQPSWWIKGMNWDAVPILADVVRGLEASMVKGGFSGGNPKNAFGGVIVKTPIGDMIGKPTVTVTDNMKAAWRD